MAKHIWTALCRKAIIDQSTQQTSLNEILEGLETSEKISRSEEDGNKLKFIPLDFNLVSYWVRSTPGKPENYSYLKVTLTCPDKSKHVQPEQKIDLKSNEKIRIILIGNAFPFVGYGEYYFLVQFKKSRKKTERWIKVAEIPLTLSYKKK